MPTPKRKLKSFDLGKVKIEGGFWKRRLDLTSNPGVLDIYNKCRNTGRIDALKLRWKRGKPDKPHQFWDSDVAKWLEGACYSLKLRKSPKIQALVDEVANLFIKAQQEDGYINSYITTVAPRKRWKDLCSGHELYCAGHFIEAAVAHFEATGKRKLLRAAIRFADYIATVFGRDKKQKAGYPGHQGIELALIKLAHVTKQNKYAELAAYFIDQRGKRPHYFDIEAKKRGDGQHQRGGDYQQFQAHCPVRSQREVVGHAVRAMYFFSGVADVAAETCDVELLNTCKTIWKDLTLRKMYITGGIGCEPQTEAFGDPYQLPNDSAYAETCAAIGLVFFAHRMFQIDPDSKYTDIIERALYNTILAGCSDRGWKYFYTNPLGSNGNHHREKWFSTSCCPPNIMRFLNSFGKYVFSSARRGPVYVNLYAHCAGVTSICGVDVTLRMRTDYPWDGKVNISVVPDDALTFSLMLRIPSWCRKITVSVNGKRINNPPRKKGYAQIRRRWEKGDEVELLLEMPIERIAAHPGVADDVGKIAIQRGPLVYCIEQCDHSPNVRSITIGENAALTAKLNKKLFGGIVVVEGKAFAASRTGWRGKLYRPSEQTRSRTIKLRAIPYYLWDNRTPGAMEVWIPEA